MGMNAEHINPFLSAAKRVLKDMVYVDVEIGKPYLRETKFDKDYLLILLGVTGQVKGQVILNFSDMTALDIASKMCMMPLEEMNEIARSAVSELGNMILGNTATEFSNHGITIDITPPAMCKGPVNFSSMATNICVPLLYEGDKKIEINVALTDGAKSA